MRLQRKELAKELLAYLRGHEDALVHFLEELVRAETPTGSPEEHGEALKLLSEAFVGLGFEVELLPGPGYGEHLYAYPKGYEEGQPAQLMLGHYDTVWPKGTLETMPIRIVDGMMTGPGIYDMKAGLVQVIYALKALDALGQELSLAPLVLFNSDEERGSRTSTPYIAKLAQQVRRAFVMEPSLGPQGKLKTARKGVGRFTVEVLGKASHAGLAPEEGQSAILELSYVIQELFALNDLERGITVNVGMIDGGVNVNVVAPHSKAFVDVRVLTDEDAAWVAEKIHGLEPKNPSVSFQIQGEIGRPPLERTQRNRGLWKLAKLKGRELGLQLEEGVAGGGSDGNTTSRYTATLDGLGAVGDGAHAVDEFIYVERLLERCALLALLLQSPPSD